MKNEEKLKRKIKCYIVAFMVLLVLSGLTAFPLEWELSLLNQLSHWFPPAAQHWVMKVYHAVSETNSRFPFMAYGTDWLAFAHLVIAVAFIGPLKDPVRNIWVLQFGMIACLMVFPLALICGAVRDIPFYWRLIDCSFGIFGFIPLYSCYKNTLLLEKLNTQNNIL